MVQGEGGHGSGRRGEGRGDRRRSISSHLMGSKQEHSRVDAQGSTDEAVDSSIAVVRAEQGHHAAIEALADLGQVEAKPRGLGVHGTSNNCCGCG